MRPPPPSFSAWFTSAFEPFSAGITPKTRTVPKETVSIPNDYRKRREDALTNLATKIAEQVLERQEEAVLDALPAFERRIVHKALSTIGGIATYSEGEEPNRRVVIAPAE